ncbi:hypothetical protein COBT_001741 [Conglomerata obtusa]
MTNISVNDTFKSITDLDKTLQSHITTLPTRYNLPIITPKLYTVTCIGKRDFQCDALIQAILRKKDALWVIKKIKQQHRCPLEIHSVGCETYIFRRVNEIVEVKEDVQRVGMVVKMLEGRGMRVGYEGVFHAYKRMAEMVFAGKKSKDINDSTKENECNKENIMNNITDSNEVNKNNNFIKLSELKKKPYEMFIHEFKSLNNKEIKIKANENIIFVEFIELKKLCRNVIEIKVIEKNDGYVCYAILFDPHDFPIIYSFVVSEDKELKDTLKFLFNEINDGYFNFIVEYNKEVLEILEELKIMYLVKTRDICKEVHKNEKDREIIETIFGICNGLIQRKGGFEEISKKKKKIKHEEAVKPNNSSLENNNREMEPFAYDKIITLIKSVISLDEERFIKGWESSSTSANKNYFNLQNMHEIDLDYIHSSVYSFGLLECFNGIISLLQISDEKENFGMNVKMRIEKNKKIGKDLIIINNDKEIIDNKVLTKGAIKNNYKDDNNASNDNNNVSNVNSANNTPTIFTVCGEGKEYTVNLEKSTCTCGKFQRLLIPCVHACAVLENPFEYVSILYSKEFFLFDYNLIPVIEDAVKVEKGRYLKVAGRPKKKRIRKTQSDKENNDK